MKRSLLDTDTLSFYLKGVPAVVARARQYVEQFAGLDFTIITYYEIRRGLLHAGARRKAEEFEKLAAASRTWPLDLAGGRRAAEICVRLWRQGTPLDDADILIAGIALADDMVLVTNNDQHFRRISGLELDNWLPGQFKTSTSRVRGILDRNIFTTGGGDLAAIRGARVVSREVTDIELP